MVLLTYCSVQIYSSLRFCITLVTTTSPPSTTPEECAEDLDVYPPVNVMREESDTGTTLTRDDWWYPNNPPDDENLPYKGSYLDVTFSPRVQITSVIIKSQQGQPGDITVAFQFQPGDRLTYLPLIDETGSRVFYGQPDTKIPMPPSMPYVTGMKVFIITSNQDGYKVIFNGCEREGMFTQTVSSVQPCESQIC